MIALPRYLVGLDVGSTKTCAVLVETRGSGNGADRPLRVLGIGTAPAGGMAGAAVTDLEATVDSIRVSVREAELTAGREVESAYVGIAGLHAAVSRSSGVVAVGGAEVDGEDVRRVEEVGRAVVLAPDRELLHAIPQEYVVDGRAGIRDPLGMTATRLESEVCIVTAASTVCRELRKAVDRAGWRPEELVLQPLASGLAVLRDSEREEGVALVEVGGDATDLVVFRSHKIRHVRTLPWGANAVTSDIAKGLGVSVEEACRLKERFGVARRDGVDPAERIDVSDRSPGAGRKISRELLAHIIEQRVDEIFGLVHDELEEEGLLEGLGAGVVLTGGGIALPRSLELARSVFNLPVRLGEPGEGIDGLADAVRRPRCATAVGLAMYGSAREPRGSLAGASRVLGRIAEFLKDFF